MKNKNWFINGWKRFFEPVKDIKHKVAWLMWFGAFLAILQILTIETFRYTTDFLEAWSEKLFIYAIIALTCIELIDIAHQRYFKTIDYYLDNSLLKKIYAYVIKGFMSLDHDFAEKLWIGRLQSIVLNGISKRRNFIYNLLVEWTYILVLMLGAIIILFKTNIHIGFWTLGALVVVFSIFIFKNKGDRNYRRKCKNIEVEKDRLAAMHMMSKFEIIQSDNLESEIDKYNGIVDRLTVIQTERWFYNFLAYRGIFSFFNLMQIGIYLLAWYFYLEGKITLADFFVIALSLRSIMKILIDVRGLMRTFSKEFVNIEKIWDTFDNWPKIKWVHEGATFVPVSWNIKFEDISFGYEKDHKVIGGLTVDFHWWKKTALVGTSWWWKSTIAKLIAWYIKPDSGNIVVDDQKLSVVSLKSYYKHIGYLTQEPSIFDGTILENLTYGTTSKVSDHRLREVITMAQCDFLRDFKDGLDTEIGERGVRLSWWQKQRLAIAKIFLKDPSIIILDEPTSALDSKSEEGITLAMNNLFKKRTVIVIAHRLQTVKTAHEIIVIDDWTIVERWNHEELILLGWAYAHMLEIQTWF